MATYADYPPQTMSSSNIDFTLFPAAYQDAWTQELPYIPASTYADQAYLTATAAFDSSYDAQSQSYAPTSNPFAYPNHSKSHLQETHNNTLSPATSASHSLEFPVPPVLSSTSDSGHSTISSAVGSPLTQPQSNEWSAPQNIFPGIVQQHEGMFQQPTTFDLEALSDKTCVDPSLTCIQPFSPTQYAGAQFPDMQTAVSSPHTLGYSHAPSPAPSRTSAPSPQQSNGATINAASPYMRQQNWHPYPHHNGARRNSISSVHSRHSQNSLASDDSNKGLCPIPTCGRHVKDLKAHMLTHQNERPEKCPIPTCDYHVKGFARKYDKNRHTLTHYKGTMVCGFCPGSGSSAEKSFNRADVFKRHLTSVHNVEQTPPNARRKSPASSKQRQYGAREVSGMCSTCGNTFANAQDFYEHLDDCVLRVVQQADPSEAVNEKLLNSMNDDKQVQETMEKHMLSTTVDYTTSTPYDDEEDEEEEVDEDEANDSSYAGRSGRSGKGAIKSRKSVNPSSQLTHPRGAGAHSHVSSAGAVSKPPRKGLTYSTNGVPLTAMTGKGSKRRKDYPLSWGTAQEHMRMKKRVLCVYDGQRRLVKDDMMLDANHEVRMPINSMAGALSGGRAPYITDLDEQTLLRAHGFHNATEEEKDGGEAVMKRLMES